MKWIIKNGTFFPDLKTDQSDHDGSETVTNIIELIKVSISRKKMIILVKGKKNTYYLFREMNFLKKDMFFLILKEMKY